jgi:hypothetical protein
VRLSPDDRERVFLAVADERRSIAALIDDGHVPQPPRLPKPCDEKPITGSVRQ